MSVTIPLAQIHQIDLAKSESFVSVEYPCFVSSVSKAIALIGGTATYQNILAESCDTATLDLHSNCRDCSGSLLQSNVDMLRSPVQSTFVDRSNSGLTVVIKIKRKKIRSKSDYSLSVLGSVHTVVSFPYPADIQVC